MGIISNQGIKTMNNVQTNPRVLIVTPEVTYLPHRMGGLASFYTAKA